MATAEATDTTSPWGLMSLVDHVRRGLVDLDAEVAERLHHCVGCRACTDACDHAVDVDGVLVTARMVAVDRGVSPHPRERFERPPLPLEALQRLERFERRPGVSLLPGRTALERTPRAVDAVLALCERLDVDTVACGDAAALEVGYDLWHAGHHDAFVERAREVHAAIRGSRELVVMSPEALYTLKHIYPRFGFTFDGALIHVSELLTQLLASAVVRRLPGRVAYHGNAYLARHLGLGEVARGVLRRILAEPYIDLVGLDSGVSCCGAAGALTRTVPSTARRMAEAVIAQAIAAKADRVVTFSSECVVSLREVAPPELSIQHAATLVAEAVIGDGAAG